MTKFAIYLVLWVFLAPLATEEAPTTIESHQIPPPTGTPNVLPDCEAGPSGLCKNQGWRFLEDKETLEEENVIEPDEGGSNQTLLNTGCPKITRYEGVPGVVEKNGLHIRDHRGRKWWTRPFLDLQKCRNFGT